MTMFLPYKLLYLLTPSILFSGLQQCPSPKFFRNVKLVLAGATADPLLLLFLPLWAPPRLFSASCTMIWLMCGMLLRRLRLSLPPRPPNPWLLSVPSAVTTSMSVLFAASVAVMCMVLTMFVCCLLVCMPAPLVRCRTWVLSGAAPAFPLSCRPPLTLVRRGLLPSLHRTPLPRPRR